MEGKFKFFVTGRRPAYGAPVKKCMRAAPISTYTCLEYQIPCPR